MADNRNNEHLLFAILALQNGFIGRAQLREATSKWLNDKSQSLADILVAQQALSEDERHLLAALVRKHLGRSEGDVSRSFSVLNSIAGNLGVQSLGVTQVEETLAFLTSPKSNESGDRFIVSSTNMVDAEETIAFDLPASETVAQSRVPTPASISQEYELLGELGRGGMGVVYHAMQRSAGRKVALKLIRSDRLNELDADVRREAIDRFRIEAKAAARLDHDNIVTVYDVGELGGCPYYSMRYVEGQSLAQRVQDGPISGKQAAEYLTQVAKGVQHAHANGILHRDIKPHNVLIEKRNDRALITDFGLAKFAELDGGSQLTMTGEGPRGTPSYMSPEQVLDFSKVDILTDVYALGGVLYYCVTGRPPFQAKTIHDTLRQVLDVEPARPTLVNPDVDKDIETICMKCLEKEQTRRYTSAQEVADELDRYLRGDPILARPPSFLERSWRKARRHKGALASVLTVLAVLVVAIIMSFDFRLKTRSQALVSSLWTAEPAEIATLVDTFEPLRERINPLITAELQIAKQEKNRDRLVRARMGLTPTDAKQAQWLADELATCDTSFILPICEMLTPYAAKVSPKLWENAAAEQDPLRQLRWSCGLAKLDPDGARWQEVRSNVVNTVAHQNSFLVAQLWSDALQPAAMQLKNELLQLYVSSADSQTRATTAQLISDWLRSDAQSLARFLIIADHRHYQFAASQLDTDQERKTASRYLEATLAESTFRVSEESPAEEWTAFRRANGIAALTALTDYSKLRPHLAWQPNPEVRSWLIHHVEKLAPDAATLWNELKDEPDPAVRRALILRLGTAFQSDVNNERVETLVEIFRGDGDAGVHSATEWALKQFGLRTRIEKEKLVMSLRRGTQLPDEHRQWYLNGQGQTFVLVPGGRFIMGSGRSQEPKLKAAVRPFAISATEITREQFLRFDDSHAFEPKWSHKPDCPVGVVNWYKAANYCNWLSKEEGIPREQWCYPENVGPEDRIDAKTISRLGYRLPTDAEWEFACRSGTTTIRYYGDDDELLRYYAWYEQLPPISQPVGVLKPNDFGLFDMYGNAWEWCGSFLSESYANHTSDFSKVNCVIRSEPAEKGAGMMRSAMRNFASPSQETVATGLRVVRTLPSNQDESR